MTELIKLKPFVVSKIWGGEKLARMKNITHDPSEQRIGETWEASLLKEGPSFDESGTPLSEIIGPDSFDYLVKYIDTSDDLSIQVHPGDEYARLHENSLGKTECWFILAAVEGCGIYLGLKEGVDKLTLEQALRDKEDISQLLNFIPVKKGDFFFVPAGTIHAIGRGITLAEVQQSSGITYRVWDWNRVDDQGQSRELHVKKALDVINFSQDKNSISNFQAHSIQKNESVKTLIEHRDFNLDYFRLKDSFDIRISRSKQQRPATLLNLDQEIIVNGDRINAYQTLLINGEGELKITPQEESISETVSFLYIY